MKMLSYDSCRHFFDCLFIWFVGHVIHRVKRVSTSLIWSKNHYLPSWPRTLAGILLSVISFFRPHNGLGSKRHKLCVPRKRSEVNSVDWHCHVISTAEAVAIYLHNPLMSAQKRFVVPHRIKQPEHHPSSNPRPDIIWHNSCIKRFHIHISIWLVESHYFVTWRHCQKSRKTNLFADLSSFGALRENFQSIRNCLSFRIWKKSVVWAQ